MQIFKYREFFIDVYLQSDAWKNTTDYLEYALVFQFNNHPNNRVIP